MHGFLRAHVRLFSVWCGAEVVDVSEVACLFLGELFIVVDLYGEGGLRVGASGGGGCCCHG